MKSRTQKQEEALKRQTAYDSLSLDEKIYQIACRRGESKRELAKLMQSKNQKQAESVERRDARKK